MHNAYLILKSPGAHAVLIDIKKNILRWLRLSTSLKKIGCTPKQN